MRTCKESILRVSVRCPGITLLEILIVVAIIGILVSALAVRIVGKPEKARILQARLHIETLEGALKLFKLDNAFYPSTEQGLRALVEKPTIGRVPKKWREGGYIEKGVVPKDPWGNDYLYMSPGIHNRDFDLWTYGADEEEGGEGEDADIANWLPKEE
jgi:general secretion pathway protein G